MTGEEYNYRGTTFLVECKEHINRVAGPGNRNYIIRGILSHGEDVEIPGTIDGDPVTSFTPGAGELKDRVFEGIKSISIPEFLGRFPERNDIFPDLMSVMVDPENRIYSTDGKMLFKNRGQELFLSLSSGMTEERVIVPEHVKYLGPEAFLAARCKEIVFENPWIEAEDTSFDFSAWLEEQKGAAYVGNMLYRVHSGESRIVINRDTKRVHRTAFKDQETGKTLKIYIPERVTPRGFTEALYTSGKEALRKNEGVHKGIITISGKDELPFPLSPDRYGTHIMEKIWDMGEGSPENYDEIFRHITDKTEKLDFALFAVAEGRETPASDYRSLITDEGEGALNRSIEILPEALLFQLIKSNCFSRETLLSVIPALQSRGLFSVTALILSKSSAE